MSEYHPWNDPHATPRNFDRALEPPIGGINPQDFQNFYDYQDRLVLDRIMQEDRRGYASRSDEVTQSPPEGLWGPEERKWREQAAIQAEARRDVYLRKLYETGRRYTEAELRYPAQRAAKQDYEKIEQGNLREGIESHFDGWMDVRFLHDEVEKLRTSFFTKVVKPPHLLDMQYDSILECVHATAAKPVTPAELRLAHLGNLDMLIAAYEHLFGKFWSGLPLEAYSLSPFRVWQKEDFAGFTVSKREECLKELILILRFRRLY